MNNLISVLRNMRASNLMFLLVMPVIVYLLAVSRNYGAAIYAVLGIEDDASLLLGNFILFCSAGATGFWGALQIVKSLSPDILPEDSSRYRFKAFAAFLLQAILLGFLSQASWIDPYISSIAVNAYDPRTVDWIIIIDQSFALDPVFKSELLEWTHKSLWQLAIVSSVLAVLSIFGSQLLNSGVGFWFSLVLLILQFSFLFYFLMMAHAGFAVGIMITIRAAIFAYIGASILGLVWAFLSRLKVSLIAERVIFLIGVICLIGATIFVIQPKKEVFLVGDLSGRIGIVAGIPSHVSDTVRYGDFLEQPPENPYKVRSLKGLDLAVKLLDEGRISAALLPSELIGERPVVWGTEYLEPFNATMAKVGYVLGILSILLVVVGRITMAHPLAVFSDFFVDTIRGVPMLVIILYVGLPLAGAVKTASSGYIDIQMMTRGIAAIAIGYSAYMAEIFRAGIEAIPKGQIEASRALGLRERHIARFIVIPQAIAIVLPALGNEFIAMLKDTSLISILSVRDLTQRMREFQAQSFLAFEPFNSAALIYVLLTLIAASGVKALDKIVNKSRGHE
ncbi:amino acid ABC transporter permease [Paracoccaceae bacterium]|nr:ABC transporter permease subunit [Paracoccaceae bacterium]MDB3860083.1 amino acid ABC transporter permease [Paracoccaceae bacterium]